MRQEEDRWALEWVHSVSQKGCGALGAEAGAAVEGASWGARDLPGGIRGWGGREGGGEERGRTSSPPQGGHACERQEHYPRQERGRRGQRALQSGEEDVGNSKKRAVKEQLSGSTNMSLTE